MSNRIFLLCCLFFVSLLNHSQTTAANQQSVTLQFEYGNGFSKQYKSIPITQGDTILDVMKAMQKHPQRILFKTRGTGKLTFIYEIDMISNEGRGKNWIFYVNGRRATIGVGAYKIKANDQVMWKYEVFQ
ncbi:MAG: hypothetical protein CMJ76_09625 [Planctomycetaceae bacterium]|nr:hypothetical protein [Planctomycetaceae bacterium]|tara:strand:- start:1101 stop:1490 length:390 start_codon:yes stop_codon:yes gene_type:complete